MTPQSKNITQMLGIFPFWFKCSLIVYSRTRKSFLRRHGKNFELNYLGEACFFNIEKKSEIEITKEDEVKKLAEKK